jgi:hypothetical protein
MTDVQVTRNVPPKRVAVNDGNTVAWADKSFSGGDSLVLPGPMADQLALGGHVTITDHDASSEVKTYKHADGKNADPVDVTTDRQEGTAR